MRSLDVNFFSLIFSSDLIFFSDLVLSKYEYN
jgi:hypothetical protein